MGPDQQSGGRGRRVSVVGTVVGNKMQKTITVREDRLVRHALYGKFVRRSTLYKAHDEQGEARLGDQVEIAFTRPLSKTKRWRLVRVIARDALAAETLGGAAEGGEVAS